MKKIYFAVSYANRSIFKDEIKALSAFFLTKKMELFVFVDVYNFAPNQEQEMMQTACKEIDSSNMLIAELTTKSIGVGIEIGYAYAQNKPVIYLRKKGAAYSTTAAGCSKKSIIYTNKEDLVVQINNALF